MAMSQIVCCELNDNAKIAHPSRAEWFDRFGFGWRLKSVGYGILNKRPTIRNSNLGYECGNKLTMLLELLASKWSEAA